MILIVSPLIVKGHLIIMCNPKNIADISINPFQSSVLPHKSCLKYRITCGTKLLLVSSFNLCTKYPHLYIIRLRRVLQLYNFIAKYICLEILRRIVTAQLANRDNLFLSTHGIFMNVGAIYQSLIISLDSTSVSPLTSRDRLDYLPVPLSTTTTNNF